MCTSTAGSAPCPNAPMDMVAITASAVKRAAQAVAATLAALTQAQGDTAATQKHSASAAAVTSSVFSLPARSSAAVASAARSPPSSSPPAPTDYPSKKRRVGSASTSPTGQPSEPVDVLPLWPLSDPCRSDSAFTPEPVAASGSALWLERLSDLAPVFASLAYVPMTRCHGYGKRWRDP